jgi:hypothetical protein
MGKRHAWQPVTMCQNCGLRLAGCHNDALYWECTQQYHPAQHAVHKLLRAQTQHTQYDPTKPMLSKWDALD